jgi:riboflavin synthase
MFTGIVEAIGKVTSVDTRESNRIFTIEAPFAKELKIDQSVAHDGVCLTVIEVDNNTYKVEAIKETLDKTTLSRWKVGYNVNLERCLPVHGRFDGHIVQGHVDTTATCIEKIEEQGSWRFFFKYPPEKGITVPKGSITVNGVSLTVVDSEDGIFSVAIIPYTYEHTNFCFLSEGDQVNIEFDIIGKYVQRLVKGYQ